MCATKAASCINILCRCMPAASMHAAQQLKASRDMKKRSPVYKYIQSSGCVFDYLDPQVVLQLEHQVVELLQLFADAHVHQPVLKLQDEAPQQL